MKKLTKTLAITGFFVVIVAVWSVGAVTAPVQNKVAAQENQQEQPGQEKIVYEYEAQAGDSYTKMARKAVQTYGKKFNNNLSLAKIIYAETNLTLEAKSQELNVGQKVSIDEDVVEKWVSSAEKISSVEEKSWNYYVQFVDFNTDKVGVSS